MTKHPPQIRPLLLEAKDYKRLLESVTDYIYTVKVNQGEVVATYHGPASVKVTGYTSQEYETDPQLWQSMVYEEDRPAVWKQAAQALAGVAVPPLEHRIIHKAGFVRWVRNTPVLRYDDQGVFVGYDGLITDITERKQAEEELRQSEARQRALLKAIPDLMFRLSREGQFLDYHPGKNWDYAWLDEGCIGKNVSQVLPPELVQLILDHVAKALQTGVTQVFECRLKQNLHVHDCEIRLVVSGAAEVLGLVRNITEQKRMEEQVIQAERLAALGRLSAALTHEINHPLQLIQSHVELLLNFPVEPGEEKELLQVMAREVERLNETTRRVLDFARPLPAQRRRVMVADLLQEVLALTGVQLHQSKIKVTTSFNETPPVLAAPDQLMQVFLNLVINAIEVVPPQGHLNLTVYAEGGQVITSFTNSGPTIPPEILAHIFEPFFTTKPQGSGLGLWVSHNLIHQHGGLLAVANLGDEQGVVFTVTLPAAAPLELKDENSVR